MAFGSGGFGSVPFGSAFASLPTAPEVLYIEFMAADLVRVWFNEDIVINDLYKDTSNYVIVDGNLRQLPVRGVVRTSAISLPYALLRVNPQIAGQSYSITVSNLVDRTGVPVSSVANTGVWVYNRTKGDSIISSMPSMYDTTAGSNLRGLLQAIANEQNLFSGAPSGPDEDE